MLSIRLSLHQLVNKTATILTRRITSSSLQGTAPQLARTKDGSTIVAYHPPQSYPYEFTKPLPEQKVQPTDTVLKTQLSPELMSIYNKKSPEIARQELMSITYTTKHRWFPRSRDKRRKPVLIERPYL